MEQIRRAYEEYYYYILMADIGIGLLLGLIPLILGIKKNQRNFGIIGLIASVIGGVLSPILSIIIVSIFVFLILRKAKTETPVESEEIIKSEPVE
jgi:hypothetical protein